MPRMSSFLKSEDGAVTVDWVVLTAAVVGLAIGVVTLVVQGATDTSASLGATLTNATPPEVNLPNYNGG